MSVPPSEQDDWGVVDELDFSFDEEEIDKEYKSKNKRAREIPLEDLEPVENHTFPEQLSTKREWTVWQPIIKRLGEEFIPDATEDTGGSRLSAARRKKKQQEREEEAVENHTFPSQPVCAPFLKDNFELIKILGEEGAAFQEAEFAQMDKKKRYHKTQQETDNEEAIENHTFPESLLFTNNRLTANDLIAIIKIMGEEGRALQGDEEEDGGSSFRKRFRKKQKSEDNESNASAAENGTFVDKSQLTFNLNLTPSDLIPIVKTMGEEGRS